MPQTINVGGRVCVRGWDDSQYQPTLDAAQARDEGYAFGVIKASEGNGWTDPAWSWHVDNIEKANLPWLAYHFARPDGTPDADGAAEADFVLTKLAGHDSCRGLVLDLEASSLDAAGTAAYVVAFWNRVCVVRPDWAREQRVTYVGKWFGYQHVQAIHDLSVLWIPAYTVGYTADPDPSLIPLPAWSDDLWPEGWAIWQYTSSGTVAGVHPVDCNVATLDWWNAVATPQHQEGLSMADVQTILDKLDAQHAESGTWMQDQAKNVVTLTGALLLRASVGIVQKVSEALDAHAAGTATPLDTNALHDAIKADIEEAVSQAHLDIEGSVTFGS